jgi:hypothetical protein
MKGDSPTTSKEYTYGQQSYEQGKSFLNNPYHPWTDQDRFFSWSKGWWDKNNYYENLSREELRKELVIEDEQALARQAKRQEEDAAKKAEEKYKKSKKGKQEAAGQGTLFG